MSSQMYLQCLPAELLHEILLYAVNHPDLKQTLRLRLVNRKATRISSLAAPPLPKHLITNQEEEADRGAGDFSLDVIKALYETNVLEDHIKQSKIVVNGGLEHDRFWQEYLTQKIYRNKVSLSAREQTVRDAAVRLWKQIGEDNPGLLRDFVHALCYQPHRTLSIEALPKLQPWDPNRHLLQAAIIIDRMEVVESLLDCPDFHGVFGGFTGSLYYSEPAELWANPINLAAHFARADILELFFTNSRLNRRSLRAQAFGPAIRAGHLDIAAYISDPAWGSNDFILGASCVHEDLVTGMLRSPLIDFSSQIYTLCGSLSTPEYSIQILKPDVNHLLHDIACQSPERVDVAMWLLDHGAVVQQTLPPRNRVVASLLPAEPCLPWNPLRQAVKGGNEKMVRLLLDRGADPTTTDTDVLELAVKRGRLDIVRMLIEHTSESEARPKQWKSSNSKASKSLLSFATFTGNEKLCEYLRRSHVQEPQVAAVSKALNLDATKLASEEAALMATASRSIFKFQARETNDGNDNIRRQSPRPRRRAQW